MQQHQSMGGSSCQWPRTNHTDLLICFIWICGFRGPGMVPLCPSRDSVQFPGINGPLSLTWTYFLTNNYLFKYSTKQIDICFYPLRFVPIFLCVLPSLGLSLLRLAIAESTCLSRSGVSNMVHGMSGCNPNNTLSIIYIWSFL